MGVGKVVRELHGMLKLVFVIMVATICVCCWAIGEVIGVIKMVVDELAAMACMYLISKVF